MIFGHTVTLWHDKVPLKSTSSSEQLPETYNTGTLLGIPQKPLQFLHIKYVICICQLRSLCRHFVICYQVMGDLVDLWWCTTWPPEMGFFPRIPSLMLGQP